MLPAIYVPPLLYPTLPRGTSEQLNNLAFLGGWFRQDMGA